MGKSGNSSVGWTDIAMMLSSLDIVHAGKSGILITTAGQGHNGVLHITLTTVFDVVPGSKMPQSIETESNYPCPDCATLEGHIFGGLYAHDFAIGEAYQQRFLPGTE